MRQEKLEKLLSEYLDEYVNSIQVEYATILQSIQKEMEGLTISEIGEIVTEFGSANSFMMVRSMSSIADLVPEDEKPVYIKAICKALNVIINNAPNYLPEKMQEEYFDSSLDNLKEKLTILEKNQGNVH